MGKLQLSESERRHEWYSRRFRNTTINMPMSHGTREIKDFILGQMAKQLHLTGPQLRAAIECSFSGADYDTLLDHLFPEQLPLPEEATPQKKSPRRSSRR